MSIGLVRSGSVHGNVPGCFEYGDETLGSIISEYLTSFSISTLLHTVSLLLRSVNSSFISTVLTVAVQMLCAAFIN